MYPTLFCPTVTVESNASWGMSSSAEGHAYGCMNLRIASFLGHSQILSQLAWLQDKIWEWPGNKAMLQTHDCMYVQMHVQIYLFFTSSITIHNSTVIYMYKVSTTISVLA